MPIAEAVISGVVDAVASYVIEQSGPSDLIRSKFGADPMRRAFKRALRAALTDLEARHPTWVAALFDSSFLENEGTHVLAQLLIRDGHPDPSLLAALWADSLNIRDPERRTARTREIEPIAADFLSILSGYLKGERDLDDLNDSRAFEQLARDVQSIRYSLESRLATPGTRRDYLRWVAERNLYLDTRGTLQTYRQLQVKLNEVFVSIQAQREDAPTIADQRILEQDISLLELQLATNKVLPEEAEDRREQLLAQFERNRLQERIANPDKVMELTQCVNRHERLVVLGSPGSGKTTLLRYLALKHAEAILEGRPFAATLHPSVARFPLLVRIADYAEKDAWKEKPLSSFLSDSFVLHECPSEGLANLVEKELELGNCLVLLDGLDEIVDPDDRRGVVRRIDDFIRRYSRQNNRFVVTSRIAGYRSASLDSTFTHYTIQEMNDFQIRRFLQQWCLEVESMQTPELSLEMRQAKAQIEANNIMREIEGSAGVRRLAANPLLLRILVLIHRAGARLPQRRIELYKLAADTLARTWRTAQGVPETALTLLEEHYLTRLLSRMAYWLHQNKSTGIATQQEVYTVFGEEWARLNNMTWSEDDPNPYVLSQVDSFLRIVREHTGLFVERAPKRFGFMHLTFEEYYAARYLVARRRDAASVIRRHIQDSRWQEPILLALGFVGLDYPDEAAELIETAVLAQGSEARQLDFKPSQYEELLGRDFLFAVRCLADQIPANPSVIGELLARYTDELITLSGLAKFWRYREELMKMLPGLGSSYVGERIVHTLLDATSSKDYDIRERGARCLGLTGISSPLVISTLLAMLSERATGTAQIRKAAATGLGQLSHDSDDVVSALLASTEDEMWEVGVACIQSIGQLGRSSPKISGVLIRLIGDSRWEIRNSAILSLGHLGQVSSDAVDAMRNALDDPSWRVRASAVDSLGRLGRVSPDIIGDLLARQTDRVFQVRQSLAQSLGLLGYSSTEVIEALIGLVQDPYGQVRERAVVSVGQLKPISPGILPVLEKSLGDPFWDVRIAAAESLLELGTKDPDAIVTLARNMYQLPWAARDRLLRNVSESIQLSTEAASTLLQALLEDSTSARSIANDFETTLLDALSSLRFELRLSAAESLGKQLRISRKATAGLVRAMSDARIEVQFEAAQSLAQHGKVTADVLSVAVNTLRSAEEPTLRVRAARLLGQVGDGSADLVTQLMSSLTDLSVEVNAACAEALAQIGRRLPDMVPTLAEKLADLIGGYSYKDYYYDALWLLVSSNPDGVGSD